MGRSYLGSRENISTGQIMLFCSYGEMFSRLPGKVSRGDVDFVKCKQKVFPLSGKVVFIWHKNYLSHRDLACHQARSRLTGELFVSYERKATFHTIFVRRRDLACKCFLANRENFFPYEQALSHREYLCWLCTSTRTGIQYIECKTCIIIQFFWKSSLYLLQGFWHVTFFSLEISF